MEKIKFFILTLLCMGGVMHVCAQEVVTWEGEPVEQKINVASVSPAGVIGASDNDRTVNSWTSNTSYDELGNCLVIDDNGTSNGAIKVEGEALRFEVTRVHPITIKVFAPLGWHIVKYEFTVCQYKKNVDIKTESGTYRIGDSDRSTKRDKTRYITNLSELSDSFVSFELETDDWGGLLTATPSVYFEDFKVVLVKDGDAKKDAINGVPTSTVDDGHWTWKQENPVPGNTYKIVNGSSTSDKLIVIGQKNNSTVDSSDNEDSDVVGVTDNIEEGGEWLYGEDYTLTNYTDRPVGFYQSHVGRIGFNVGTEWRVSPLAVGGVAGFAISNKPALVSGVVEFSRCYLKLSDTFESISGAGIDMGKLGWEQDERDFFGNKSSVTHNIINNIFIWNFYSLDQYKCYISYKEAYYDFINLETKPTEADSYYQTYLDLLAEIENTPAQGYDEATREATYDRIRRMLELIATIKIDYPSPGGEGDPKSDFNNPGAEEGTVDWEYTPTGTGTTNVSATPPGHEGNNKFELENIKMSQEIKNLIPGVYHVSVYWKADEGSEIDFVAEGVYDKQKVELEGNGGDDWQKATLEVVVVTGKRLTVSAAAKTGTGKAYLDDFKLDYFSQNYYYDDAATKTRMYKGVFNAKQLAPKTNVDNKYIDKNIEKEFKCNTDNDFVATVDKDYPYADITNLAFYSKFKFDNSANPNGLVYAKPYAVTKEGTTTLADNVIIAGKDGLECDNLVLQNNYPYSSKWAFTAGESHYDMNSFGVGVDNDNDKVAYGTLMLPYEVDVPSDASVEVYAASKVVDGVLNLGKPLEKIEANKPYILKYKDADAKDKLFGAYNESAQEIVVEPLNVSHVNGVFVGAYQLSDVPSDGSCYLLQVQNGRLAFYNVVESGFKIGPFRCYLKLDTPAPSKISIAFDDVENGISVVEDAVSADEIYDLQGRRVQSASKAGIYVKNGKKVLVK